jgi:hypothetical protein
MSAKSSSSCWNDLSPTCPWGPRQQRLVHVGALQHAAFQDLEILPNMIVDSRLQNPAAWFMDSRAASRALKKWFEA